MTNMVIDNTHDGQVDRVLGALLHDGNQKYFDADQFTRFVLHVGSTVVDSDIAGLGADLPFDPTLSITMDLGGTDVPVLALRMTLGQLGLAAGTYPGKLVCYNAEFPNGIVWDRGFTVKVIAP